MDRREFLKGLALLAALAPLHGFAAKTGGAQSRETAETELTRRRYKNTSETLPLLGFGMMRLPRTPSGSIDEAVAQRMVDRAMEAGVNYFDTAWPYHGGQSEIFTGKALKKHPRESFYLADKMPVWEVRETSDFERIFNEQLRKCQVDYFDFYLVHTLNAGSWKNMKDKKIIPFLDRMKKEGKIRRVGFSFHDRPQALPGILGDYPWEFVQLQINYLEWEQGAAREIYETASKAGVPIIIMEPLRGGALIRLPEQSAAALKRADRNATPASWALRFAGSLPNVLVVLSGMSLPEHLEENIRTFSPLKPLSDAERAALADSVRIRSVKDAVPCTSCEYCLPCPVGIPIPKIFSAYNDAKLGRDFQHDFQKAYAAIDPEERASACVKCNKCVKHCPQGIDVPKELARIDKEWNSISS